jgi:hypothetical protein
MSFIIGFGLGMIVGSILTIVLIVKFFSLLKRLLFK